VTSSESRLGHGHPVDLEFRVPSPVQELNDERLSRRGVRVFLKRDDLINAELPGNKWRKLKYNLEAAGRPSDRLFGHDHPAQDRGASVPRREDRQ
jgi:hypothetical protein